MIKIIFLIVGSLSLGLGVLGVFIPGLPTTPFLLLTAAMYARSSDRLHKKLLENKYVGKYITNFERNKSMSLRVKLYSIGLMWIMISLSTLLTYHPVWVKLVIVSLGLVGTIVMGFVVPTQKND